jgi:hypothetical protein
MLSVTSQICCVIWYEIRMLILYIHPYVIRVSFIAGYEIDEANINGKRKFICWHILYYSQYNH